MKSFQLPDISNKFVANSSALHQSLVASDRDWDLISHNINAINTLLTPRFTIPISNELYKERTHITQTRTCQNCYEKKYRTIFDEEGNPSKEYYEERTEVPLTQIKLYDERVTLVTSILLGADSRKAWLCPKCNNRNLVLDTPKTNREYQSNATFGVIYEKPTYSLAIRASYDRLCMVWLTYFLREIDMGLMAFQKEYFEQHQSGMKEDINPISHNI